MAYSRWSNSIWYTYNNSSLDNHKRDEQLFTICTVKSFSYKELKEDIEKCLDIACQKQCLIDTILDESLIPSEEERQELRGYMLKFINAVETDKELF